MPPETLGQLIDRHAAALTLYARQWTVWAEEVVQEAFLKLAQQREPPTRPLAWLYRVVRHTALTYRRAETRRQRHETRAGTESAAWFETQPATEATLDAQTACAALQALPLELREVLVLHLWSDWSFADIADLLGVSTATAYRRYVEGLHRLRERLGVPCPNPPTN